MTTIKVFLFLQLKLKTKSMEQSKTGNCSALSVQVKKRRKSQNCKSNSSALTFFQSFTQHDCESSLAMREQEEKKKREESHQVCLTVAAVIVFAHIFRTGFGSEEQQQLTCVTVEPVNDGVSVRDFLSVLQSTSSPPSTAQLINTRRSMTHSRWLSCTQKPTKATTTTAKICFTSSL